MTFNATTRSLDNETDSQRTFPSSALTPNVLRDNEGAVCEKITGPGPSATVRLSRPAVRVNHIISYTTATGVASTGGGKKEHLALTTDFTVVGSDSTGVAALTNAGATDYSAETWVVFYSPLSEDRTIGGVSSARR
jgi:hypothetical protein